MHARRLQPFVLAPVLAYRRLVSPFLAPRCRFHPTCSRYALMCVREFGLARGLVLAAWRVLRCNPWSAGGIDAPTDQGLFRVRGNARGHSVG